MFRNNDIKPRKLSLEDRVRKASDAVLKRDGVVGPIPLLIQARFLEKCHFDDWKAGKSHSPEALEDRIQLGPKKMQNLWSVFAAWVRQTGLQPIQASYLRTSRDGQSVELQITTDGNADREAFYRTHYTSGDLSEQKQRRVEKKLTAAPDITVFIVQTERSECRDCHCEFVKSDLMYLEDGEPLCLPCADLDHLEFLPSGDAAMTRRAKKHSPLSAIVVEFNRRRKRNERRGILVTSAAIDAAETECAGDEVQRAARRLRDADRRAMQDSDLAHNMASLIVDLFPACPAAEAQRIAEHTAIRGSGRVGRSAAGRALDNQAVTLAVIAWIRHQYTNYDNLLMNGTDRREARRQIRSAVDQQLKDWSQR